MSIKVENNVNRVGATPRNSRRGNRDDNVRSVRVAPKPPEALTDEERKAIEFSIDARKFAVVGMFASSDEMRYQLRHVQIRSLGKSGVEFQASDGRVAARWVDKSAETYLRGVPDRFERFGILPDKAFQSYARKKNAIAPTLYCKDGFIEMPSTATNSLAMKLQHVDSRGDRMPEIERCCEWDTDKSKLEDGMVCANLELLKPLFDRLLKEGTRDGVSYRFWRQVDKLPGGSESHRYLIEPFEKAHNDGFQVVAMSLRIDK